METHSSSFTKLASLGFLFLFTLWCSSFYAAFAISEEANALLKWKSTLSTKTQYVLLSWALIPADQNATNSKSSSDPCTWYGISCNKYGSVSRMNLSDSGLKGTLEEFPFSSLPNLMRIDLSQNKLFGILPPQISNLSNLVYLNLALNSLHAKIPPQIGQLQHLESLFLGSNSFRGPIPFTVGNLKKLRVFSLSYNNLSGPIPSELGNMTSLRYLRLASNNLIGCIPKSLGRLKNLVVLSLSRNRLSNSIPEFDIFSNLQNLEELDLSSNHNLSFKTGIKANITLPVLSSLDLSCCDLKQFPEFIRGSYNLTTLDLSNNRIEGPIPKWMWDIGRDTLVSLYLSNNSLMGGLESFPWKKIVYVDLRSNKFQGVLPVLPNGTGFLSVSNNSFTGEISSEICNADSLEILDLSHNNFSGKIPSCLSRLGKSLSVLSLQDNNFQGNVHSEFPKGCRLLNLNLHGNQMEGPLPRSLANCGMLQVLDVGNNNIKDTFPSWLGSLSKLQMLVLRSNKFHGSLSNNTETNSFFPKLRILDLSSNDFNGSLPIHYIENLKAMMDTHRSANSSAYMQTGEGNFRYQFSVVITLKGQNKEMEKILTICTSIDLSKNKFVGEIPGVIGKLRSLKGLNLSHNFLSGNISPSIMDLANLESLDLSRNHLVGEIPEELLSLTQLELLNLSNNQLVGRIPQGNQFSTFGNDSYQGNLGLCGPPVSKTCDRKGITEQPPASFHEKYEFWEFGWRPVLIGGGCGTLFGLLMGFLMFQTGKPRWFVSSFDLYPRLRARKMNRARRHIQRRN